MDYKNDLDTTFLPKKIKEKIWFINKFLEKNEKILLGISGHLPIRIFEHFYDGIISLYKECILIFTNKRIFFIHIEANYSFKNIIQEILYEDVKDFNFKKGKLFIQYKNLKKDMFRINRNLSEEIINKIKIKEYIKNHNTETFSNGIHYICPRCGNRLVKGIYNCSNCNLEFHNKEKLMKYFLFLPGIVLLLYKNLIKYLIFICITIVELLEIFCSFLYYIFYSDKSFKGVIILVFCIILIPVSGYLSLKTSEEFIPKNKIVMP